MEIWNASSHVEKIFQHLKRNFISLRNPLYPLFIMYNVPSIFFSQKMVSISLLSDLSFSTILDVDANLILRQNPWWSNFNFSGQKPLYQNNFKHIAFFFTLFKGYKCNKLYEITPKKGPYWSPRKQTPKASNFTKWSLALVIFIFSGSRKKLSLVLIQITNYIC